MSKAAKKYTLFKAEGGEKAPCAFFARGECRNGASCKFSHDKASSSSSSKKSTAAADSDDDSDSSSVLSTDSSDADVSSESDDEPPPPPPVQQSKRQQKQVAPQDSSSAASKVAPSKKAAAAVVVAAPPPSKTKIPKASSAPVAAALSPAPAAAPSAKKAKQQAATSPPALAPKSTPAPPSVPSGASSAQKPKPKPVVSSPPVASSAAASLLARFPVKAFSTAAPEVAAVKEHKKGKADEAVAKKRKADDKVEEEGKKKSKTTEEADAKEKKKAASTLPPMTTSSSIVPSSPASAPAPARTAQPLGPSKTPENKTYKKLLEATRAHPRFKGLFNLPLNDIDWFAPKEFGVGDASALSLKRRIVAIDCEMCETTDPLTGATDSKALSRLSVVCGLDPSVVLLDTLVKPYWPITDYRTKINGITQEHMVGVDFTLRHAQAFMDCICDEQTIIAGHAVHNDLISLKMNHTRVLDSSFLYTVAGEEQSPPSLKDLAKQVLGKDMPRTHDSVNDARTALELIMSFKSKGQVDQIVRSPRQALSSSRSSSSSSPSRPSTNGPETCLVHRVPAGVTAGFLSKIIAKHAKIVPTEVTDVVYPEGAMGRCIVRFKSKEHCEMAFDALVGPAKGDVNGRMQKRIYTKAGEYVFIRRNSNVPAKVLKAQSAPLEEEEEEVDYEDADDEEEEEEEEDEDKEEDV